MIVAKYNLRSANYSRGWVVTCEDGCGGECGIQDAEKEYFTPTVQLCTKVESSKQEALEPAEKSRGPIPRFDVPAFKIVEKHGVRFSRVSGFDYDQCFDNGADVPAINDIAVDTAERASVGDINRDELRLWTVAFINSVYAMAQLVASVHFNSLAMRADAFHTMSDVLAAITARAKEALKSAPSLLAAAYCLPRLPTCALRRGGFAHWGGREAAAVQ